MLIIHLYLIKEFNQLHVLYATRILNLSSKVIEVWQISVAFKNKDDERCSCTLYLSTDIKLYGHETISIIYTMHKAGSSISKATFAPTTYTIWHTKFHIYNVCLRICGCGIAFLSLCLFIHIMQTVVQFVKISIKEAKNNRCWLHGHIYTPTWLNDNFIPKNIRFIYMYQSIWVGGTKRSFTKISQLKTY